MLKALRENFKHLQSILWAVIAVFVIFVFADWGMGSQRGGAGDTALAAKAPRPRLAPRRAPAAPRGPGSRLGGGPARPA